MKVQALSVWTVMTRRGHCWDVAAQNRDEAEAIVRAYLATGTPLTVAKRDLTVLTKERT